MFTTQDFKCPKTFAPSCGASRRLFAPAIALAISLFASSPAWAVGSVLSGMFDGSEPVIDPLFMSDCADAPLGYVQSSFEVSESGAYYFQDAFGVLSWTGGVDVATLIYEGSFDASAPEQNLIASQGLSYPTEEASLSANASYVLVVQLLCKRAKGAWAVAFTGPGTVSSDHAVAVPSFTSGVFAADGPTLRQAGNCTDDWGPYDALYQQSGPIQVSRDGTYYFSDAAGGVYSGLCLGVYTAPLDPEEPWVNWVGSAWGYGPIELKAGQDYYFVAQGGCKEANCDYFFVLAPPAPFRINHGLADSWYNPATPGQGFFLDVFEQRNEVFLGWFTYAIDPAVDDEFGHRWLTAFGPFAGTSANLAIEWTAGGGFDAAYPVPEQHVDGSIQLEFNDCTSGQISYLWGGDGIASGEESGVIPIQRNANDAVALCESLYAGPGMPGPL